MYRQHLTSNSSCICERRSVWNGEEYLLIRAPRLYEEIETAIKGCRRPFIQRGYRHDSRSKSHAVALARRLSQIGWRPSRMGLVKSRVAVLMPVCSRKYVLDKLVGSILMAYRADIIDVGVIVSRCSNRIATSRTRFTSRSLHRSAHTNQPPRSDFQAFLPPAPMVFLEIAN